jgi:hypothetical protein
VKKVIFHEKSEKKSEKSEISEISEKSEFVEALFITFFTFFSKVDLQDQLEFRKKGYQKINISKSTNP